MTPQEKAKFLISEFGGYVSGFTAKAITLHAKACAIIAVDEIINAFDDCSCQPILPGTFGLKEWMQVKKQIELL